MIEERRTINSQFDNQLEKFDTNSEYERAVPEKGAIIYTEMGQPDVYIGDGEKWLRLAKADEIPTVSNGYQVAYDNEHTNSTNAQNLTAVEQEVENNVATSLGDLSVYDGTKFYFMDRTIYTITISFTSSVSANNQHAELFFGYSGISYNGDSDILYYAKGNGVAHQFSRTYQIVGDSSTAEGIKLYIFPSHAGKIWGAKFTIQQAF